MDVGKPPSGGAAPAARFALVADDDATMRDVLRSLLSDAGYTVLLAATGREALSLASHVNASLAIVDLDMPQGNGLQMCASLRKMPHWADVPILILTHHHTDRALQAAVRVGASGFVGKPFVPTELLRHIVTHTGWQASSAELGSPVVWRGDPAAGRKPIPSAPLARPRTATYPIAPPSLDQQRETLKVLRSIATPGDERRSLSLDLIRQRFRILVGEADPVGQEAIRDMLSSAGLIVEFVADGRVVLWKLIHDHYDVVVLDVHMPGAGGIEIAHSIRALRGPKGNTPIIALTQSIAHLLGRDLRDAGINGYVMKPVTSEALIDCLMPFLPKPPSPDPESQQGQAPDIATLRRVAGAFPPGAFVRLLDKFAAAVEKTLAALDKARPGAIPDELARQLHSLAGTAGTLGCGALSAAAHDLHTDCADPPHKRVLFIGAARTTLTSVGAYLAAEGASAEQV
jgi:CheY-like chemotaxis protein